MCKSMAEGGQRCASHTREKLTVKAAAVEAAVTAFSDGTGDPAALRAAQDEWEAAAAEYASTDEGHAHLSAQAAAADDMDTQALLNTVIAKGEALRAANRETAALLKAVKLAQSTPVTPAAGGLVRANGSAIAPPDESLFDRAVVPDLSAKDREAWVAGLAEFDEVAPMIESVGMWSRYGSGNQKPDEVRQGLVEMDERISDATLDDDQTCSLLRQVERYRGMHTQMPRFVPHELERLDGESYNDHQDRLQEASFARSRRWSAFIGPFEKTLEAQADRVLSHPGAGHKTFEAAQESVHRKAEELTAHPNAPMSYLRQIARKAPTTMSAEGWQRLRNSRLRSDGTSDAGAAMILAMHDPDSFHRNEAYAHVEVIDFDSVSEKQRNYLSRNLHRLPGNPARQAILATSLVEWAKMSGDAKQQAAMYQTLAKSKTPQVAEVGAKALTGAGLALPEPDNAAEAEPEKTRWFSRR